jgi:histidinol-phosphate aminotransferase
VEVVPHACAPFLLVRAPGRSDVREGLRARGVAVRRGDTFPGLGPEWFRVAVRGAEARDRLTTGLAAVLGNPV